MSADTIAENRRRPLAPGRDLWLFGYGSLIYKTEFPYLERRPARLQGWARRFWQGSHDHRGTPEAPGRVVTLVRRADAVCDGVAYLVAPTVFERLDVREKNGYLRIRDWVHFRDGSRRLAVVYVADHDNAAFLGPASAAAIARHVAVASGPSGRNRDYVTELAAALRELGTEDLHVSAIERALARLD